MTGSPSRPDDIGPVYFEIRVLGNAAQVTAIHAATGTEVKVTCPATLARSSMQLAALRRLQSVLAKQVG